MTTTEALITDRLDDLREGTPGTVRSTVDAFLSAAWNALYERQQNDADGVITAQAHIDEALAVLAAYRDRLTALGERDSDEHAAEWVKAQAS